MTKEEYINNLKDSFSSGFEILNVNFENKTTNVISNTKVNITGILSEEYQTSEGTYTNKDQIQFTVKNIRNKNG